MRAVDSKLRIWERKNMIKERFELNTKDDKFLEKETGRERQSRKVGTASVLCG
jgi:hypothetical protein